MERPFRLFLEQNLRGTKLGLDRVGVSYVSRNLQPIPGAKQFESEWRQIRPIFLSGQSEAGTITQQVYDVVCYQQDTQGRSLLSKKDYRSKVLPEFEEKLDWQRPDQWVLAVEKLGLRLSEVSFFAALVWSLARGVGPENSPTLPLAAMLLSVGGGFHFEKKLAEARANVFKRLDWRGKLRMFGWLEDGINAYRIDAR